MILQELGSSSAAPSRQSLFIMRCQSRSRNPGQGRIQGGGVMGADDPPPPSASLKMMASFRTIEPFSLAKLQFFQTFSSYCCIKHSKLTSKVQNLVEIEHFTVKKQLIASRSRQLRGVVNQFVGVSKILRRASRAHSALTPFS